MKGSKMISIDADILAEVRMKGVNVSQICEDALKDYLSKGRAIPEDAAHLEAALLMTAQKMEQSIADSEAVEAEKRDFYAIANAFPEDRRAVIREVKAKRKETERGFWGECLNMFRKRVSPAPPSQKEGETKP